MQFKIYISKECKHTASVTCLGWNNNEDTFSVSDDHQIYKWNVKSKECTQVAKLPDDFFATDLHWLVNRTSSNALKNSSSNSGADSLLITSSDGRFIILNKNARVERNIVAHPDRTITAGRWSPDGAGIMTAAEDGIIKVWSRSGMLRSTVVQNEGVIRSACWAPKSDAISYCQGPFIAIKPLAANSKLRKWRAHDGLILCLDWSNDTMLLASGGEDCRYKIWDNQGAIIYSSSEEEYAITSIAFCPNGQLLAIGGFSMLKLCNYNGWSHSTIKFNAQSVGSLYSISWSYDCTQIIAGSSSGLLICGHIIEVEKISKNLKAKTIGRQTIQLQDLIGQTMDTLDFPDRIINWSLGYGHLVVATTSQVHVYNEKYTNTPLSVIDGRYDVSIIILAKKNFLIVDNSSIWIYTYTGRLHLNPKYSGLQAQLGSINGKLISLGLHYMINRDHSDQSLLLVFDLIPGASRQNEAISVQTKTAVTQVAVCRAGIQEDQYVAFIDVNRDLFCGMIQNNGATFEFYKIGTQLLSFLWSSEANILVGLHDSSYSIWYCPGEACVDPTLIALTTLTFDTTEFGKNVTLDNFEGPNITFKSSGALYTIQVNYFCETLHRMIADDMWQQALKMCRHCQNVTLWATLAAIASKKNQLEITEESYAATLQIDKVHYSQYIKNLPTSSANQMAETSIMLGRIREAETILLHNKKPAEVVLMYLRMHQYERALDIANQHNLEYDSVLKERHRYLKALGKEEYNEKFLKLNSNNIK